MHNSIPDNWNEKDVTSDGRVYWSDEGDLIVRVDHIVIHFADDRFEGSFFGLTGHSAYEYTQELIWSLHATRSKTDE